LLQTTAQPHTIAQINVKYRAALGTFKLPFAYFARHAFVVVKEQRHKIGLIYCVAGQQRLYTACIVMASCATRERVNDGICYWSTLD
jgi:hypothetical protein